MWYKWAQTHVNEESMMNNERIININGCRLMYNGQPYMVNGPISSEESLDGVDIQIENSVASYKRLSHTTSLDIMKLIFTKKTLRCSSLSSAKLNDSMEMQRVGISQFAGSRFIACFTYRDIESIPFWSHYGGSVKEKKVQLQFRNFAPSIRDFIFTDYALLADGRKVFFISDEFIRTVNTNGPLGCQSGLPKINTDYSLSNCIRSISVFNLKYEPAGSDVLTKDYSSKVNIRFGKDKKSNNSIPEIPMYEAEVLGWYKSEPWDYEKETRIMCTLQDQEFSKWEYIDLRLKDEVFRDLKVILSPWADITLEEKVKELISNSDLSGDIQESIKIEHSVVEGTLNL